MSLTIKENTRLKVWEVNKERNSIKVSTSEKDKGGKYINSYWWFKLNWNAKKQIDSIAAGDVLYTKWAKVTTFKDDDGNFHTYNLLMDFTKERASATPSAEEPKVAEPPKEVNFIDEPKDEFEEIINDDNLPF